MNFFEQSYRPANSRANTVQCVKQPSAKIVDNRPQTIAQRKIQETISNNAVQPNAGVVQRLIRIGYGALSGEYTTAGGKETKTLLMLIDKAYGKKLKRGWKGFLVVWAKNKKKYKFDSTSDLIKFLLKKFPATGKYRKRIRPSFPRAAYDLGRVTLGLKTGKNQAAFSPSENDAALPHRFPYASIRKGTEKYIAKKEDTGTLIRWSDRLKKATEDRLTINESRITDSGARNSYKIKVALQLGFFESARNKLIAAVEGGKTLTLISRETQDFLKWANALHGNVPDYGPHSVVNIPVSDRLHMHFESGRLTPGSKAAGAMTPTRTRGLAMTNDGDGIVTTDGKVVKYSALHADDKKLLDRHVKSNTTIARDDLTGSNY